MSLTLSNLSFATFLSLDYGKSYGSGFKLTYGNVTYLITAKHVLFNDEGNERCEKILVTSQNSRGRQEDAQTIVIDATKLTIYNSSSSDVAIIRMEENEFNHVEQLGVNIVSIQIEDSKMINEIEIANEVYLIGFPTSLIVQGAPNFDINKPLLRKGIVAGINNLDNTFIIDCSAYYGNSGSPIIEKQADSSLKLIGLVSKYIPFVTEWRNNREPSISHVEFSNSGYTVCVSMDEILLLINSI